MPKKGLFWPVFLVKYNQINSCLMKENGLEWTLDFFKEVGLGCVSFVQVSCISGTILPDFAHKTKKGNQL